METRTDLEKCKEEKDAVSIKYVNIILAEHKKIDEKYGRLINRSMDGGKARRSSLQFVKREAGLVDPIEDLPQKKKKADMEDTPDNLPGTSANVRQNAIGEVRDIKTTNTTINLENKKPISQFFIKDILNPSNLKK